MRPDQEHVCSMVTDTILLLCKNGLTFKKSIKVQGLLGITVDDSDVFLIQLDDTFQSNLFEVTNVDLNENSQQLMPFSNPDVGIDHSSGDGLINNIGQQRKDLEQPVGMSKLQKCGRTQRTQKQSKQVLHPEIGDVITIKDEADDNEFPWDTSNMQFQGTEELSGRGILPDSSNFMADFGDLVKAEDSFGAFGGTTCNFDASKSSSGSQYAAPVKEEYEYGINDICYDQNYSRGNYSSKNMGRQSVTKRERTFAKPKTDKYQPAKSILSKYKQQQQQSSSPYVVTKSLHECGYPNCGKQFRHKQHLLRHQTQKHGRTPTKFLTLQKVWSRHGSEADYESEQYDPGLAYE